MQEKPSALKTEHPALQNKKTSLLLWVIFALLDPDPADIDWIQMMRPKLYFKDAVPRRLYFPALQ